MTNEYSDTRNLVTKIDIETLRREFQLDLVEAKSELFKVTFGTIGFQAIVILGEVIALAKMSHG